MHVFLQLRVNDEIHHVRMAPQLCSLLCTVPQVPIRQELNLVYMTLEKLYTQSIEKLKCFT